MLRKVEDRENVWRITIELPREADGKRQRRWYTVRGNKKAAEKRLRELQTGVDAGTHVEAPKMTVATYMGRWLTDYAAVHVSPNTAETYRYFVDSYIAPHLGTIPLERLTGLQVQGFYAAMLKAGGVRGRGISGTTLRHVHALLRQALQHAVDWRLLARSPMDGVRAPKRDRVEPPVLDDAAAANRLLDVAAGSWLEIPVLLAVALTLRRGEVLGLRWSDVDLPNQKLSVRQAVTQQADGSLHFGDPKTEAGLRTIDLPAFVADDLRRHKGRQAADKLAWGPSWEADLVVCNPGGSPRTPDNLTSGFAKLAKQAGCPQVTFHGLRHTAVTFLLERGIAPHVVAKIAGHSDVATTLRIYARVLARMQTQAAGEIEAAFDRQRPVETARA